MATTTADEAASVAGEAASKARDLVDEAVGQVSDHSRSQLENLVDLLRSMGDDLQGMVAGDQGAGVAGDVVRQLADRAHAAGDRLEGREPGELLEDLRRFARQRPAVFFGGALLAGVLAGRMARGLKDSRDSGDSRGEKAVRTSGADSSPVDTRSSSPGSPGSPSSPSTLTGGPVEPATDPMLAPSDRQGP